MPTISKRPEKYSTFQAVLHHKQGSLAPTQHEMRTVSALAANAIRKMKGKPLVTGGKQLFKTKSKKYYKSNKNKTKKNRSR